ncbi:mRNA interferase MazF [Bacillus horti]|uniref:mRNA interferase MazF n=2 Tax=Caldalkalibacillus horti TaxID=77523 RepID=A0ABT9VV75_9BACI|nr:mRNA interferase MazF [Bacillus horti]
MFKVRPVVIVGHDLTIDIDVIISPITSAAPRSEFDVVIEFWKESGLLYPSVARTTKLASIPRKELMRKLGKLNEQDLKNVISQCRKLF